MGKWSQVGVFESTRADVECFIRRAGCWQAKDPPTLLVAAIDGILYLLSLTILEGLI